MKWFRMYVEIIDDPKMKQVSDRSFRVFNYLLAKQKWYEYQYRKHGKWLWRDRKGVK